MNKQIIFLLNILMLAGSSCKDSSDFEYQRSVTNSIALTSIISSKCYY